MQLLHRARCWCVTFLAFADDYDEAAEDIDAAMHQQETGMDSVDIDLNPGNGGVGLGRRKRRIPSKIGMDRDKVVCTEAEQFLNF